MLLCGVGRCRKRMLPAYQQTEDAVARKPLQPPCWCAPRELRMETNRLSAVEPSASSCPQLTLRGFRMEKNRILTLYN